MPGETPVQLAAPVITRQPALIPDGLIAAGMRHKGDMRFCYEAWRFLLRVVAWIATGLALDLALVALASGSSG